MAHERITVDPAQMAGVACIRHLRIPVSVIVELVADGMSTDEILQHYPSLEAEDIRAALLYAADLASERTLPLVSS